jgi:ATP-dependent Clp protease ATP-binding subunit ClpB
MQSTQDIKEQIERAKIDMDAARRATDLARMSELQYGVIPGLEQKLKLAQEREAQGGSENTLVRNKVTEHEIAEVVSKWTHIPVSKMLEGEKEKLLQLEAELHKSVIGQDEAVIAVANAIRRSRAGLSDPNRPVGSFLFMGPTGVGKTELCKSLASFLFDGDASMVRIDMSEFMEKHSVARLIGAPPGYVGYEQGGYLTEAVRRRPYSLILLDEVEKAHADVFNILLQVLDDGRLTDGQGRTVDFRNTIVVMTSNIGSDIIQSYAGNDYAKMKEAVSAVLTDYFRPEFVNRIDETVVFHALTKINIAKIATIQIARIVKRIAEKGYELQVAADAIDFLCDRGYDPVFGARPLKRTITQYLENPLASAILSGVVKPHLLITAKVVGDSIVLV